MTEQQFEIKDSGERRDFESGAQRDVDYDKPRFDLIPMTVLQRMIEYYSNEIGYGDIVDVGFDEISDECKAKMWSLGLLWGATVKESLLLDIVWLSSWVIRQQEGDDLLGVDISSHSGFHLISPKTYLRLAKHYGGGAKKYDPWNWSKGMPLSVFYASLMRHIFSFVIGDTDEDHLSGIFFNAAAILHFQIIGRKDIDDITPRLEEWFPKE